MSEAIIVYQCGLHQPQVRRLRGGWAGYVDPDHAAARSSGMETDPQFTAKNAAGEQLGLRMHGARATRSTTRRRCISSITWLKKNIAGHEGGGGRVTGSCSAAPASRRRC